MTRICAGLAAAAVLGAAGPASAQDRSLQDIWQEARVQAAVGFDYSVGKYGGTSDTRVLSIPLDVRMRLGRWRLEATAPYLDVKGSGSVTGGIVVGGSSIAATRSGLGDITGGAAWLARADSAVLPAVEFEGFVKVPTASDGLGTGKFDYTVQTNLYHSITPRVMLLGTIGYQWLSNYRTYILKDGVLLLAGVNFKTAQDVSIGVSANYRQEYYRRLGKQVSVSPYMLWDFDANWRVSVYGIVGATKASPRYGLGMRLIFSG